MQHEAIVRRGWRRRLRDAIPVRLAGASVLVLALLAAPVGRAATGGRAVSGGHATVTQRPPGYLGIEFHDLTSDQAAALHLRDNRGVEVLLVDHDGPAASAGLQPHDLITGINGHIVASGEALRRMIRETGAGVEVKLSVFRNGNPITIRTKLANQEMVERKAWARLNQPEAQPQGPVGEETTGPYLGGAVPTPAAAPPPHAQGFIDKMVHGSVVHATGDGIIVDALQPQLASFFGVPDGRGLLVQSVEDGSPASAAGLHAGDVIVRADGQPMHAASEWTKHLHAAKGKPVAVDVLRDHQRITLTLQAQAKKR